MQFDAIGIKKQKENQFIKAGIHTVEELAAFLPRRYKDYTRETGIMTPPLESCLVVFVESVRLKQGKVDIVIADCVDKATGTRISVMWFNQYWRRNQIEYLKGKDVYLAGKVALKDGYGYSCVNPDVFEENSKGGRKIYPVYRSIPGMSQEYLETQMKYALATPEAVSETIPSDILSQYGYIGRKEALIKLHTPQSMADVEVGQKRILFDDLLYFALNLEASDRKSSKGSSFSIKSLKRYQALLNSLPYDLTTDQRSSVESMLQHARDGRRINALLQGDVGCGKSIVAFLLMTAMVDSGYQAALMAPTQVLARQHYEDLSKLVKSLDVRVAFLDGGLKQSEKKRLYADIESGGTDLVVGTQAILGKDVRFRKLAMVITDEEHRFGVAQRETLVEKAADGVHSITMSATPIPRSLASVVYGDSLQLFTIRTMPAGRKPVVTGIATGRDKIYRFILNESKKGHQTYVVCPMIDKNEDYEGVKSVEEVAREYQDALSPHGIKVETLTGRNKKDEVEDIIERFKQGTINVLVSTTVIEVGVNVPTATLIVVSNAERFGLATLHQLRGRVGRGQFQSYCVLEAGEGVTADNERLNAMVSTNDGFEIAEADLKLRGAGDFIGTMQHGDNKYISLMLAYPEVYHQARDAAKILIDRGDESLCVKAALGRASSV